MEKVSDPKLYPPIAAISFTLGFICLRAMNLAMYPIEEVFYNISTI